MLRLREEAPFTRSRAKSAQELSPLLIARFSLARLTVKRDGSMPTAARLASKPNSAWAQAILVAPGPEQNSVIA